MQINLIKLETEFKHPSYHYKPIDWCCRKLQKSDFFTITNEHLVSPIWHLDQELIDELSDEDWDKVEEMEEDMSPKFCLTRETVDYDGFSLFSNFPIRYCPFCGERIDFRVAVVKNVRMKVNELQKNIDDLREKQKKTDSRKKYTEYGNQIDKYYAELHGIYEVIEEKEYEKY